jgi:hypothetical protein
MDQRGKSEAEDRLPGIPTGLEKTIARLKLPEDRAEATKLISAIKLELIHDEAYRVAVYAECSAAFTRMRIWEPVSKFLIDLIQSRRIELLTNKRIAAGEQALLTDAPCHAAWAHGHQVRSADRRRLSHGNLSGRRRGGRRVRRSIQECRAHVRSLHADHALSSR